MTCFFKKHLDKLLQLLFASSEKPGLSKEGFCTDKEKESDRPSMGQVIAKSSEKQEKVKTCKDRYFGNAFCKKDCKKFDTLTPIKNSRDPTTIIFGIK